MLLVVADLLPVGGDVRFGLRRQLLVPVALALFLLLDLLMLDAVGLLGAARVVFFQAELGCWGESADGGGGESSRTREAGEAGGDGGHIGFCLERLSLVW